MICCARLTPSGELRFKEIGEAYAILSDDQKRARYDAGDGLDPYDDSDDEGITAFDMISDPF